MEIKTQLREWLGELLYHTNDVEDHFKFIIQDRRDKLQVYFYTRDNRYSLVVTPSSSNDGTNYFGCQVSTRKPRAGEDWNRGNDLPDGKFNEETWIKIKNAIISYELVKIAKSEISSAFESDKSTNV